MLLLTSTAAMGALARIYLAWQRGDDTPRPGWANPAIFWTAIAGGILLKGPLILMLVGLCIAALLILDRSGGWLWRLRPLWGVMWTLALVLPWFVAIVLRSGEGFFADSLGGDLLSKVASPQESHGAPPGYYFVIFWLTFWPGAVLAGLAVAPVWRARREPAAQFLLAWIVPSWIVFELVITKLPHYVLPLYPAIAILITGVLEQRMLTRKAWLMPGLSWWFFAPVILSVLVIVVSIMLIRKPEFAAWPFAALAAIFGLIAWWMYDENRAERSLLNAFAASFFIGCHGLRHRAAGADAAVPERRARARAARRRVRTAARGRRRLPRAEPRLHGGNIDAAHRCLGGRGFSGARLMSFRADREPA